MSDVKRILALETLISQLLTTWGSDSGDLSRTVGNVKRILALQVGL